jgi:hypothetical protein
MGDSPDLSRASYITAIEICFANGLAMQSGFVNWWAMETCFANEWAME